MLSSQIFVRYICLLIVVEMEESFGQSTLNEISAICPQAPNFESSHSEISDQIGSQNKILEKLSDAIQGGADTRDKFITRGWVQVGMRSGRIFWIEIRDGTAASTDELLITWVRIQVGIHSVRIFRIEIRDRTAPKSYDILLHWSNNWGFHHIFSNSHTSSWF